jgi:2-oxoglutarate dehydrogenase E1 component
MTANKEFTSNSYLFGSNAPYIEELYELYLDNPNSVEEKWRTHFDNMQHELSKNNAANYSKDVAHTPIINAFAQRAKSNTAVVNVAEDANISKKRVAVQQLIAAYRNVGCRWANLDPLQRQERPSIPDLDPAFYGLKDSDLDDIHSTSNTYFGKNEMSLRELLQKLRATYSANIGAEFMHTSDQDQKRWWQEKLETVQSTPNFAANEKVDILKQLTAAEGLERYLHTKYVGQKRFSLEGGESFIPCMDEVIQYSGKHGVQEIIIGMAHRGRLNVLINILGKLPGDLFAEFEGKHPDNLPSGDVKYHNGFSSDVSTAGGPVHLSLAFNPSHLEIVNPVVIGSTKARQDKRHDKTGEHVLPVLVHGDAAFAGQGVVMETLNLALTRGYGTGGAIHVVINNQIGFTTSDPRDSRSTIYCTDVVKMIDAPVLHVNGDDPEAVVLATRLAVEYRLAFAKDVVIDIVCFRKLGHNEQDTPAVTQPLMYKKIAVHPGTRKVYADKLIAQKVIDTGRDDELVKEYRACMDKGQTTVNLVSSNFKNKYAVDWTPFLNKKWTDQADTSVPLVELKKLAEKITTVSPDIKVHPLVEKVIADRKKMGAGEQMLDWGMGEHLAFASLVASGYPVRITGQDCGRGTFTHRHAVLHDQNRERWDSGSYVPLQNIAPNQAPFLVIDSVLSEEAVLGFEYGYACADPNSLVIWEGQFGDFVNGAQVVIDQFISSGEVKWGRQSGLTLMLPHGYEGQGPEHSSARLERFLQLCADHNMQVVQPTTPAQIFHLLRRQMVRPFRKPLIILTPKSLLRNKDAVSSLNELSEGGFKPIIGELDSNINNEGKDKVKRLVLCSGKVYYDLVNARKERGFNDVAIARVEQLYPFSHKDFIDELAKYPNVTEVVWCQDEPRNQGAWFYIQHHLLEGMKANQKLGYAGRPASASPAVGYYAKHNEQQKALIEAAFSAIKSGFVNN